MKNEAKARKLLNQVFSIAEQWEDQMEEQHLAELLTCLDQAMLVINIQDPDFAYRNHLINTGA